MQQQSDNHQAHEHVYHIGNPHGEKNTWRVIILTLVMMVAEIGGGMLFGSMALLADGWHMGTHACALGITAFAYAYSRKNRGNPQFTFGTGKVAVLGGYTSGVFLLLVAAMMLIESTGRFFAPVSIRFNEAIGVAVVGLLVNLLSAYLLQGHDGHEHHHDQNIRAAYLHVLADAMTSVLAIVALVAGKSLGWWWMDPLMGIVGSLVIVKWSLGLLGDTSTILLDRAVDLESLQEAIRATVEQVPGTRVTDFHLWPVGEHHLAVILSLQARQPRSPDFYKELLAEYETIDHLTIEVNREREEI